MKNRILAALALVLGLVSTGSAGVLSGTTITLAANYDLDGAAASANAIATAQQITDSGTYTIAAQPDTPRLLNATLVDADASISACTLTVVGTLSDGTAATVTTALTGGSGAKVFAPAGVFFKTVTSISTGVCTGESGAADTVAVGTSGNPAPIYFLPYGSRPLNAFGGRGFSLEWVNRNSRVTLTDVELLAADEDNTDPLQLLDVGDLLLFNVDGTILERVIATKTSDDLATVSETVPTVSSPGIPFKYRKLYFGPDAEDAALSVSGFDAAQWTFLFVSLGNDAKVRLQCRVIGAGDAWVLVDNSAITAGTNVTKVLTVDLRLNRYDECRAGLEWATNDTDGDAGAELESITIQFAGTAIAPRK